MNWKVDPSLHRAALAAVRVVDEEISSAAITDGRKYEMPVVADRFATAIRAVGTLPICDPMLPGVTVAPRRARPER